MLTARTHTCVTQFPCPLITCIVHALLSNRITLIRARLNYVIHILLIPCVTRNSTAFPRLCRTDHYRIVCGRIGRLFTASDFLLCNEITDCTSIVFMSFIILRHSWARIYARKRYDLKIVDTEQVSYIYGWNFLIY